MQHHMTTDDYAWAEREVRATCCHKGIEFDDDVRSEMGMVLTRAIGRYDASKGASFRTFAGRRLKGLVLDVIEKRCGRYKKWRRPIVLSLSAKIPGADRGTLTIIDVLSNGEADHTLGIEYEDMVDGSSRDKRIFRLLAEGKSYSEIGHDVGVSGDRVRQIVREIQTIMELGRLTTAGGC